MPDDAAIFTQEPLISWEYMLPTQTTRSETRGQPERTLIFEVLASALHDLRTPPNINVKGRTIRNPLYHEARDWVLSGENGYLTCRDCCDWMGIEYDVLREMVAKGLKIRSIRRQNLSGHEVQINGRHKETGWTYELESRRFRLAGKQANTTQLALFAAAND